MILQIKLQKKKKKNSMVFSLNTAFGSSMRF